MSVNAAKGSASAGSDPRAPLVRIAPGASGVSIWSPSIIGVDASKDLRRFLARVFSLEEVASVELRRGEAFGRIQYRPTVDPRSALQKLSLAFQPSAQTDPSSHHRPLWSAVETLFLDGPADLPLHIRRVARVLSSWQVRYASPRRLRLSHPILRRRRDVAFRLEESLSGVLGVLSCRISTLSGSVVIRIDPLQLSPEALISRIEGFWPSLLAGLDGPPSNARLYAACGLFGLAGTGQFFVPALRPLGVLGVAVYGFPNVTTAFRQLRRGQVGLPAMYTFGLGLMLLSGMPFNATLFAVFMQSWPRLARDTFRRDQRRLFAAHRQRPIWARRLDADGALTKIDTSSLKVGDVVVVREGEIVPIDGIVVDGLAAVDEESLSGVAGAVDKVAGDPVYATAYVRDGQIHIRLLKDVARTIAAEIADLLPHADLSNLPSSLEAERVANRNAKPALALAVATVVASRLVRPAQALIRPDYITAPRLGAQLAALHDIGWALQQGILFRRVRALDLLAATDIYVLDDSAALHRRRLEIAHVFTAEDAAAIDVVRLVAAAFPAFQNERARALHERGRKFGDDIPSTFRRRRFAGIIRYHDAIGRQVEVVSAAALELADVFGSLGQSIRSSVHASAFDPNQWTDDPLLRPLFLRRDGKLLGAVAFGREGDLEAAGTIEHLRAVNRRARFVFLSDRPQQEADDVAQRLALDNALGDLDAAEKAQVIREIGPRVLWVGDGSRPGSAQAIGAATVSISVAGFRALAGDQADISFLNPSLTSLLPLRRIAGLHRASLEKDYRTLYLFNLLGAAGGVFANFGGLQAGLLSNAGTGLTYLKYRRRLANLADAFEARRGRLATKGLEVEGHPSVFLGREVTDQEPFVQSPHRTAPNQPIEPAEGV